MFEWGSGASTVWLSARAASVVSVEHDPQWAASIAPVLGPNAQVRTVPAEPMVPAHARDAVASSKPGFEGLDFRAYVDAIDQDDAAYDLIVIDGRAREACLERALAHLTPGAMILFDNVDRKRYRDAIARHASDVDVVWTRGLTPALPYPTRTALLTRVR